MIGSDDEQIIIEQAEEDLEVRQKRKRKDSILAKGKEPRKKKERVRVPYNLKEGWLNVITIYLRGHKGLRTNFFLYLIIFKYDDIRGQFQVNGINSKNN